MHFLILKVKTYNIKKIKKFKKNHYEIKINLIINKINNFKTNIYYCII